MNVRNLVQMSFSNARQMVMDAPSKRLLHSKRSTAWVESLAENFRKAFSNNRSVRVFSKRNKTNRDDFGVNELLHDVTVFSMGSVESAVHKKRIYFVREVLWQVESEFARDSRQALIDFNKLVLGSAKQKLFVGSLVRDLVTFMDVLRPAASACSGEVFAAFLPHPSKWDETQVGPKVFRFSEGKWAEYT